MIPIITRCATIEYSEELDALFLNYTDKVIGYKEFVELNQKLLEAFESLTTQYVVADIRKMGIIGVDSQKWASDVLFPAMVNHLDGKMLYHIQLLNKKDIYSTLSGNNVKRFTTDIKGLEFYQVGEEDEVAKQIKYLRQQEGA
jgi:hypothetical protein